MTIKLEQFLASKLWTKWNWGI